MRLLPALVVLALVLGACGGDDESSDPGLDRSTSPVTDEELVGTPTATEAPVNLDDSPPTDDPGQGEPDRTDPARPDPSSVIEPDPPKTTFPVPPTTGGDPIGADEALNPGEFDPGLEPFVILAVEDLAARLAVDDPDEIQVISAVLVTWSDSSMGCPLPGMEYAQVLQDGSLIELGSGGKVYRYHTGGDRITPFLCDAPFAKPPVPND